MSDSRTLEGEPERSRLASERYEIENLASRHGITPDEARILIERFGRDRETLDREAEKLRLP